MRWGGRLSQNLAELSMKREEVKTDLSDLQVQAERDFAPVSSGSQVPWGLGRLFGASKSPNSPQGHTPPTRLAGYLTVISESIAGEKAGGYCLSFFSAHLYNTNCFSHSSHLNTFYPNRRPSQWLAPSVTALTRMVSSSSTPIIRSTPEHQEQSELESEKDTDTLEMKDKVRPLRYNTYKVVSWSIIVISHLTA